jgi:NADH-quinone oxidoreductase subunit M
MMDSSVAHLLHQIDAGSALPEAAQHGESHALLQNAGTWIKNLF